MGITFDNPSGVPEPGGNYSHVARIELGEMALLVVSGQLAVGENGRLVGEGSMAEQSKRVFEILYAILAASDASFAAVVNIRTYVTDMRLIGEYAAVRGSHIAEHPPTSTTVEVSRLVIPGALVEVDLVAALPSQGA